jgi:YesN/AraC family two-component response regulator
MSKVKILIVEDELIVAEDIKRTLESFGYEVVGLAANGNTALEMAANHHPELAILDIKLKDSIDGIEIAEQLNTMFDTPVIFITAFDDNAYIKRVQNIEQYGYLIKPFNDKQLYSTIELAIHKKMTTAKRKFDDSIYRTLIENSSIGFAVLQDTLLQFVNKVFSQITEYPQNHFINQNLNQFFTLIHQDDQKIFIDLLKNVKSEDSDQKSLFKLHLKTSQGKNIGVYLAISQILYNDQYANLILLMKNNSQNDIVNIPKDDAPRNQNVVMNENTMSETTEFDLTEFFSDLNVFNNPDRLKILDYLKNSRATLNELLEFSQNSRQMVYHHLRVLEKGGFVRAIKTEKNLEYHLIKSKFDSVSKRLNQWMIEITNWHLLPANS